MTFYSKPFNHVLTRRRRLLGAELLSPVSPIANLCNRAAFPSSHIHGDTHFKTSMLDVLSEKKALSSCDMWLLLYSILLLTSMTVWIYQRTERSFWNEIETFFSHSFPLALIFTLEQLLPTDIYDFFSNFLTVSYYLSLPSFLRPLNNI